jgi:hypothetical protein
MKNRNTTVEFDERENRLVRKDFTRVVVLNALLFGLLLALYFWNRSTGQLDNIFNSLIQF